MNRPTQLTDKERALLSPRTLKSEGSPEWCWQTVNYLKESFRHVDERYRQAEEIFNELEKAKAWEKIPPDKPYGSVDAMMRAEVGIPLSTFHDRVKTARERFDPVEAAADHGGDRKGEGYQGSGTPLIGHKRDTVEIVARLKRDDPDLAERVVNGEVTPNAAARQKGWRKPRIVVSSPERIEQSLRKHMSPEDLTTLAKLLSESE